jgi:acyl-CoA reductase-like NAD-dependent aldehyde dehydrogenase
MNLSETGQPPGRLDRLYIGGAWIEPSTGALFEVVDPATEEPFYTVPAAGPDDMMRAIDAARVAFDTGPWPQLPHAERAMYLRAIAVALRDRAGRASRLWTRESGVVASAAEFMTAQIPEAYDYYADMAGTFAFEEPVTPHGGKGFGLLVREPVGVVGAIVPWNSPLSLLTYKLAPALLAGCTVVVKVAPEAPGVGYLMADIAEAVGLPPGVLNVVAADREVSELLVRDPRVDKISFTGSTAAGRRIASLCGHRIARYTLELGGKSAALVLSDFDLGKAAETLVRQAVLITGQVCSSLTRVVVSRRHHDALVEELAGRFARVDVGDPFDPRTQMGPLAMARQRDKVEGLIARGVADGATLATGGGRPRHLARGFFIEPTVFGNVDNSSTLAQEEIFGPVLTVIPADSDDHAVAIANDTIYGLNASVFTNDVDRARVIAGRIRSGTVGHNAFRSDFSMAFGGFKQSGIGREGGRDGLLPYLETKSIILRATPSPYRDLGEPERPAAPPTEGNP